MSNHQSQLSRRLAVLGVGDWKLEVVLSESARMSSAAEARFRIQSPPPTNRAVKVIDLDAATDADIMRLMGEVDRADLVLMVVRAGGNTEAVRAIGRSEEHTA